MFSFLRTSQRRFISVLLSALVSVFMLWAEVFPSGVEGAGGAEAHASSLDIGMMFNKLSYDLSSRSGSENHPLECSRTGIPIDKFGLIEKAKLVPISDTSDQPSLDLAVGPKFHFGSIHKTVGFDDAMSLAREEDRAAITANADVFVTARIVQRVVEYIYNVFTYQKLRVSDDVLRRGIAVVPRDYFVRYASVPVLIQHNRSSFDRTHIVGKPDPWADANTGLVLESLIGFNESTKLQEQNYTRKTAYEYHPSSPICDRFSPFYNLTIGVLLFFSSLVSFYYMGKYSLSDSGIKTAIAFGWLIITVLIGAQGAILIQSALFNCDSENIGASLVVPEL